MRGSRCTAQGMMVWPCKSGLGLFLKVDLPRPRMEPSRCAVQMRQRYCSQSLQTTEERILINYAEMRCGGPHGKTLHNFAILTLRIIKRSIDAHRSISVKASQQCDSDPPTKGAKPWTTER